MRLTFDVQNPARNQWFKGGTRSPRALYGAAKPPELSSIERLFDADGKKLTPLARLLASSESSIHLGRNLPLANGTRLLDALS